MRWKTEPAGVLGRPSSAGAKQDLATLYLQCRGPRRLVRMTRRRPNNRNSAKRHASQESSEFRAFSWGILTRRCFCSVGTGEWAYGVDDQTTFRKKPPVLRYQYTT